LLDEVAVIDEIQMMRDPQRGWAWTRALLGLVVSCTWQTSIGKHVLSNTQRSFASLCVEN